jgi:hypothetical protein
MSPSSSPAWPAPESTPPCAAAAIESAIEALVFGVDPDTGARLELPVVRPGSALVQHTLVVAQSDGGKNEGTA